MKYYLHGILLLLLVLGGLTGCETVDKIDGSMNNTIDRLQDKSYNQ